MNIDMLERRFRAFDERIKSVETGVPAGAAAPAAPAGPTPEEESARLAKVYEDLREVLKADVAEMIASAKAEIQAFVASLPAPVAAPAPAPVAEAEAEPAAEETPAEDA